MTTDDSDKLAEILESTLEDLSASVERMEAIVKRLESGEDEWEESIRLLSEANELANNSSQKLDRVVQDVVYGSGDEGAPQEEPLEGFPGESAERQSGTGPGEKQHSGGSDS